MGLLLMGVGGILALVTGIWLLILAFREHVLWGLAYLFVPFAALVFVIMHFDEAGKPFLGNVGACALFMVGLSLSTS